MATGEEAERLLIVDDDAGFRLLLAETLTNLGYVCAAAANGVEAEELLAKTQYPLILTDMDMPRMGGLALIAHVKEHHPATDIVVITGHGRSFGLVEAISAGAIDYLVKPFSAKELEAKLTRVFGERRLLRSFQRELATRKKSEDTLRQAQLNLQRRIREQESALNDTNTALRVILRQKELEQRRLLAGISERIRQRLLPCLERLKKSDLDEVQKRQLAVLSTELLALLVSEEGGKPALYRGLTPMESKVVNLIKQGKTSKEIAAVLRISPGTVRSHRENIRKKMQITGSRKNLYKTILSIA